MDFNPNKCLKFRALEDNCTISLANSNVDGSRYSFSTDGVIWKNDQITLENGDCAYVKGSNYPNKDDETVVGFHSTGEFEIVSGNVMSLVDGGAGEKTDIDREYGFYKLFSGTKLKSIPADLLPATVLAANCYNSMFNYCTELTEIPAGLLPATELAEYCYAHMFTNCSSLTEIPTGFLPATKLAKDCYVEMFYACNSLTTIPANLLPATELVEYCYNRMFIFCTSLTEIPAGLLPAAGLATGCYSQMFCQCRNLTTVPKGAFMAKTLTASKSCDNMFYNCRALNEIHVDFTKWPTNDALYEWVDSVAATGDFYCPSDLPEERGIHRIPVGWNLHRDVFKNSNGLMVFNGNIYIGVN